MTVCRPDWKQFQNGFMQILFSTYELYTSEYLLNTYTNITQYIITTIRLYFTWDSKIRILQIASPPPPFADYNPHLAKQRYKIIGILTFENVPDDFMWVRESYNTNLNSNCLLKQCSCNNCLQTTIWVGCGFPLLNFANPVAI